MKNIFLILFLGIVSFLLTAELFFYQAQPQTFDGWTHLVSLKQFHTALSQGSFPVSWVQGVGNYGLPLGQIAHQIPMYVGALFMFVTGNAYTAYALLTWLGAFLSCGALYWFLRRHVSELGAGVGAAFFSFAPYRIANLYIRGAIPEFWASVFIPVILAGVYDVMVAQKKHGWLTMSLGITGLALIHPMMLLVSAVLIGPYTLACWLYTKEHKVQKLVVTMLACGSGFSLAAYYLVPLFLEMKYFYYGQISREGDSFSFLSLSNFFTEHWQFTSIPGNGVRLPTLQLGVIEAGVVLLSVGLFSWLLFKQRSLKNNNLWAVASWLCAFVVAAFLALPVSNWLYQHAPLLSGIQHPWRMLTTLSLLVPLLAAWLVDFKKNNYVLAGILLVATFMIRVPQLYGKNYVAFSQNRYDFSLVNPHSTNMNPVWTSASWDYPVKNSLLEVVEGEATITPLTITPTKRVYSYHSNSDGVRLSTNTFYFPGWELHVPTMDESQHVDIEYQDPDYRGVMTFRPINQGRYDIKLIYTDTKIRLLGKIITAFTAAICLIVFFFGNKFRTTLKNNK
jgi:uncharacterized membrane protein